ncbi:hypothetical protein [Haloarcula sp. Atlit-7R]|uniref:hypothetical protein n=1 Tax=Haloarcula sp. Atlit-7R TaxID=2282125 RepID=UPI000EF1351C|nr:hypothetical protein [Haloarcula sp. Atlit-7R]
MESEDVEDLICDLTDAALEHLEGVGDVSRAVSMALDEYEKDITGNREEVRKQVAQRVDERLPDQFEYEIVHHPNQGIGIAVQTGCPQCGHEDIFNGSLTHSPAQFVGMTVDRGELQDIEGADIGDGTTLCFIDDADVSLDFVTCGLCGAELETA